MKIVREHINEKFAEESDPIHDMGIGMQNQLDLFFKKYNVDSKISTFKLLELLAKHNEQNLIDFILDSKNIDINTVYPEQYGLILSNITFEENWNIGKHLIKKGANLEKTIEEIKKHKLPKTLENLLILKDMIMKEKINEKFIEDSDPISDMEIGVNVKRNFTNEKDFYDKLVFFIPAILKRKTIPKDILLYGGYINQTYFTKILVFFRK